MNGGEPESSLASGKSRGDGPIFLVGFMGAGKTTVGRLLADRLGYEFYDLDSIIEARAGKSVQKIFAEQGEAAFRALESEAIRCCRGMKASIVALGGGAYTFEENRRALKEIGITIWLDCPLEICLERVGEDSSRPLLAGPSQMKTLFERRRPDYALADLSVDAGPGGPEDVASQIASLLEERAG